MSMTFQIAIYDTKLSDLLAIDTYIHKKLHYVSSFNLFVNADSCIYRIHNAFKLIIKSCYNYNLARAPISWGSERSYSRMLTTQRMQSPAFISEKAWLILSSG